MSGFEWPTQPGWYRGRMEDESARFSEVDLDHIPMTLQECPVCLALVQWGSEERHKQWHLNTGH